MIVLRQANKHSRNSCRCHIIGGCGTVALTQRRAMQKARAIWRRVDRAQGQGAEDPASSSRLLKNPTYSRIAIPGI